MSFFCRFGAIPVIVGSLFLATAFSCGAQQAPTPTQPPDMPQKSHEIAVRGGGGGEIVNLNLRKAEIMKLQVSNISDRGFTLTHVGVSTPSILVPIAPVILAPKESKPFELIVDSTRMVMPGQMVLYFRAEHAGDSRLLMTDLQYSSKDVGAIHPRTLTWKVGDEAKAKFAKVITLPANVKATGIQVSSDAFVATIEGDKILIMPVDTTQPQTATATLVAEPDLAKPAVIYLAITANPPEGRTPPPAAPSKTRKK